MNCDLCGSTHGPYFTGIIEGVRMALCSECKESGTDVKKIQTDSSFAPQKQERFSQAERKELVQVITPNYGAIIRRARELRELNQEDFARKLSIKTSQLHSMEAGKYEPPQDLARKLEKYLGIKLVEQHQEEDMKPATSNVGPVTIADLLRK